MSRLAIAVLVLSLVVVHDICAQTPPDSGAIAVNEIHYAPSPFTNEYIELYNRSSEPVDLSALEYADENEDYDPVTTRDVQLAPGNYVVLVRDLDAFAEVFPSVDPLTPDGWDGLNNGGDVVFVRHADSEQILDAVPYDPEWGGSNGPSLERIDPGGPSTREANFGSSQADGGGSPAAQNSIYDPDDVPPSLQRGIASSEGDSVTAVFSEPIAPSSIDASAFTFDQGGAPRVASAVVDETVRRRVHLALTAPLSSGTFTLVATNVADLRSNVRSETSTAFEFVETIAPDAGDVVVNEIQYAPSLPSNEFIEILNRSSNAVDLSELTFGDENQNFVSVAQERRPLRADSHAVIVRDSSSFAAAFPTVSFLVPDRWSALNNGGDSVFLRHGPSEKRLDHVPYRPSWGGSDGRSLERVDAAGPSDIAPNFGSSEAESGATPGRQNSIYDPDEVPPALERAFPSPEGDSVIAVFSEPVGAPSIEASSFAFEADDAPTILSATVNESAPRRVECELNEALSSGTFTLIATNVSDLAQNVQSETRTSLEFIETVVPKPGDVVVNEIHYAPSSPSNEFVELFNRSENAINLSQVSFADANQAFVSVTADRKPLRPDSHAVIVRDSSAFADAFPQVSFLVPNDWNVLDNSGDSVVLRHTPSDARLEQVPYRPSWGGNNGRSLERIDPRGPPDRATNFGTSRADARGTPGAQNTLFDRDERPPSLKRVIPSTDGDSVTAVFSEPVASSSIEASTFGFRDANAPAVVSASVAENAANRVDCEFDARLSDGRFTLTATRVSDLANNVQPETRTTFDFVTTQVPDPRDVVVNEIHYAPSSPSNEFIELFNRSQKTFDLSQLSFADDNRTFVSLTEERHPLRPNAHAVIVRDSSTFASTFPDASFVVPNEWPTLDNGGDSIFLRQRSSDTQLDHVPYRPSWGGSDGRSLERIDAAGPSDDPSNFASSADTAGATPSAQNSIYNPDDAAPDPVFAEQSGRTEATVHFSEPLQSTSVTPSSFSIRGTPPQTAQVRRDSIAVLTLARAVETSTIQVSGLQDQVGNVLRDTTFSLALRPDSGGVAINEIMYAPRTDDFDDRPDQVEYVELVNKSDQPVTLRGLHLTDRPTEEGTADTVRAGRLQSLPAAGHAVVAAAPSGPRKPSASKLATAFPNAPLGSDSVVFLPVPSTQLGLANSGDRIRVHRSDGTPLGEVQYRPSWHAEALEDPRGTALERMSVQGRPNSPDNWTSSVARHGGTPGRPNSVGPRSTGDERVEAGLEISPSPFSVEQDGATQIKYRLEDVANLIRVRIYDTRGRKVRTLEEAALAGRKGTLVWNGEDDAGEPVRIGIYIVLFEAVRSEQGTVTQFKEAVTVARPLD